MDEPTVVYEYIDQFDQSLYVGVTNDFHHRHQQHSYNDHWYGHIASIVKTVFSSREQALEVESALIKSKQPIYNKMRKDRPLARVAKLLQLERFKTRVILIDRPTAAKTTFPINNTLMSIGSVAGNWGASWVFLKIYGKIEYNIDNLRRRIHGHKPSKLDD